MHPKEHWLRAPFDPVPVSLTIPTRKPHTASQMRTSRCLIDHVSDQEALFYAETVRLSTTASTTSAMGGLALLEHKLSGREHGTKTSITRIPRKADLLEDPSNLPALHACDVSPAPQVHPHVPMQKTRSTRLAAQRGNRQRAIGFLLVMDLKTRSTSSSVLAVPAQLGVREVRAAADYSADLALGPLPCRRWRAQVCKLSGSRRI